MDDPPAYSNVVRNERRGTRPMETFYEIGSHDDYYDGETATATATTPFISRPRASAADPSLLPGFHGLPESVKFSPSAADSIGTNSQDYSFDVRDGMDCLVVKGSVQGKDGAVTLRNLSGIQFLSLKPTRGTSIPTAADEDDGADGDVGTMSFEVTSLSSVLGEILVLDGGETTQTTTVNLKGQSQNYSVHSVSVGDIAIARSGGSPPICVIHVNSSTSSKSFDGSLRFLGNCLPRVSEIEQCLCLSVAIAYTQIIPGKSVCCTSVPPSSLLVVAGNRKKGVEERAAAEREPLDQLLGCCGAIFVIFVVCLVIWGILKGIATVSCHGKTKSKGCTSSGTPNWI